MLTIVTGLHRCAWPLVDVPYIDAVQLSAVSRKLAAAVRAMPVMEKTFVLCKSRFIWHGRVDSQLILSWASRFTGLIVMGAAFSTAGLAKFVAAASAVQEISVVCNDLSEAARADVLFSGHSNVATMSLEGAELPCMVPPNVRHLHIHFDDTMTCLDPQSYREWISATLIRLTRLDRLEQLDLHIQGIKFLTSPARLNLKVLEVTLWVDVDAYEELDYNLDWLRMHTSCKLHLKVWLLTRDLQLHASLIAELQRLRVVPEVLKLIVDCVDLPSGVLKAWRSVRHGCMVIEPY